MNEELVLFCGGYPIYSNGKPKPLMILPNNRTLLETYLTQVSLNDFSKVTLLIEEKFSLEFERVLREKQANYLRVELLKVSDGSTTLDKFEKYLSLQSGSYNNTLFSYPDIFYFGKVWDSFNEFDFQTTIGISSIFFQSRFPLMTFNPYTRLAHSVTLRPPRVPANPSSIYGGHLMGSCHFLSEHLELFLKGNTFRKTLTLEGDFFAYLISQGVLKVTLLRDKWIKIDSTREIYDLLEIID